MAASKIVQLSISQLALEPCHRLRELDIEIPRYSRRTETKKFDLISGFDVLLYDGCVFLTTAVRPGKTLQETAFAAVCNAIFFKPNEIITKEVCLLAHGYESIPLVHTKYDNFLVESDYHEEIFRYLKTKAHASLKPSTAEKFDSSYTLEMMTSLVEIKRV
jgi:hypothetical protein